VRKCEKYYVLLPAERTSVILPAFVKASQSEGTHKSLSKYVKGYETDKMNTNSRFLVVLYLVL